ncbi:hypothetical protein [Brevibacillus brevis]|uniref:Recombinase zinc beta ribbon domain-containing protein n=1 Tax=Brevibacillus brevis TaxID=1393 RepID=A0ABY9TCJ8_BREBE|nr:hypothetical protein [Brevibacillus brevis]WNC17835.1 hypothetical protein RGB73_27430 [Brevibacillus brevis]
MMGNCRPIRRSKMKYVTYRCGNRDNKKNRDNKELRREHIENFVISELHSKIFNDEVIPQLVEQLKPEFVEYRKTGGIDCTKSKTARSQQAARQHRFGCRPRLHPSVFPGENVGIGGTEKYSLFFQHQRAGNGQQKNSHHGRHPATTVWHV